MLTCLESVRFPFFTGPLAYMLDRLEALPEELVITSAIDSEHVRNSAHYLGRALDIRVHDLNARAEQLARGDRILAALGDKFEVTLEEPGANRFTTGAHLHVQLLPAASWP